MKKIFGKAYLLLIGLSIAIAFSLISFIISFRLNHKMDEVRNIISRGVYHQKSQFVTGEFDKLNDNLKMIGRIIQRMDYMTDPKAAIPALQASLPEDSMINRVWYSLIQKNDTITHHLVHRKEKYEETIAFAPISDWIKQQPSSARSSFALITANDTLHMLIGERIKLSKDKEVFYGIDINLKKLNLYFSNVDPWGQAYFSIIDERGRFLCNPDITAIGQPGYKIAQDSALTGVLNDHNVHSEIVQSAYLNIPVKQYYAFFPFRDQHWILIVSTPISVFEEELNTIRKDTFLLGTLSILIIVSIVIIAQRKWQKEFELRENVERMSEKLKIKTQQLQLEAETREKENAILQLKVLKDKMDPHFLFNCFGSLNALIQRDPETARQFVVKLSKVYRYILDTKTENLSYVKDEIAFADQYYFLLKIRFREALREIEVDIKAEHLFRHLPFMSIQGAIENAIKHNEISKTKPMRISIQSFEEGILIINNFQPRQDEVDSTRQGTSYLKSIYSYFGNEGFYARREDNTYICYLPLL